MEDAESVIFLRGTLAHSGKSSWLEEAIASNYDHAVLDKTNKTSSWWHVRTVIGGVRFDMAHHASMGQLPWTEKRAAHRVAEIILWRYCIDMKQKPPDIALRSHNHRYANSADNYDTQAICTLSWSSATEYAHRTGKENSVAQVGGHFITIQNGEYQHKKIEYEPIESRRVWQLKL